MLKIVTTLIVMFFTYTMYRRVTEAAYTKANPVNWTDHVFVIFLVVDNCIYIKNIIEHYM